LSVFLRQGFCDLGRRRERRGLRVHERCADEPRAQKPGAKKWPLVRAAKFREETPRKGGGLAIEDRDTALQQYAGSEPCTQVRNDPLSKKLSPENQEKFGILNDPITGAWLELRLCIAKNAVFLLI
jgi:hypothetical protein